MKPEKCSECWPIGRDDAADILGLKRSYLNNEPEILGPPRGRIGSSFWWWKHDIERLRDERAGK